MPRKRRPHYPRNSPVPPHPSPTSDSASQPPPPDWSPAPPPPQPDPQPHTAPGPSAPSTSPQPPGSLPLGWTQAECNTLSYHLYKNIADFDDSLECWRRITPHFPNKTLQELRLFTFLYLKSHGIFPYNPEWFPEADSDEIKITNLKGAPSKGDTEDVAQSEGDKEEPMEWESTPAVENPKASSPPPPTIENPQPPKETHLPSLEAAVRRQYFDWTLEESRTLFKLIERKPWLMMSKEGWKKLTRYFPEKKASDIGRHISMVQLAAVFMGGLDSILVRKVDGSSAGQDAAVSSGDRRQPSTLVEVDDPQQSADGMLREPRGVTSPDSPPSTSGRPSSSKPSPSTSGGRGGRRKKK